MYLDRQLLFDTNVRAVLRRWFPTIPSRWLRDMDIGKRRVRDEPLLFAEKNYPADSLCVSALRKYIIREQLSQVMISSPRFTSRTVCGRSDI